jgi:hypothetical protein
MAAKTRSLFAVSVIVLVVGLDHGQNFVWKFQSRQNGTPSRLPDGLFSNQKSQFR